MKAAPGWLIVEGLEDHREPCDAYFAYRVLSSGDPLYSDGELVSLTTRRAVRIPTRDERWVVAVPAKDVFMSLPQWPLWGEP